MVAAFRRRRRCFILAVGVAIVGLMAAGLSAQQGNQERDDKQAPVKKFIDRFTEPIRITESKPVVVNGAEFVAVAQTNWHAPTPRNDPELHIVAPLEIQLRITNQTKKDLFFSTFKTFGIKVTVVGGEELMARRVRNTTTKTRPWVLPAGVACALCPRAELRWNDKQNAPELAYYDDSGFQSIIGPLRPGQHRLTFWYKVAVDSQGDQKPDEQIWTGMVETTEVLVDVGKDTIRGRGADNVRVATDWTEPLRFRESKPITENGAKFTVCAESHWTPRRDRKLPVEIQLRITNLSQHDLLFHTFDTWGLKVLRADRKKMLRWTGRDLTAITRPLLLAKGVSFSLGSHQATSTKIGRGSELCWNADSAAPDLVHRDGTGTTSCYGPLAPGAYQLGFWYSASTNRGIGRYTKPGTSPYARWNGAITTEEVQVDIRHPR